MINHTQIIKGETDALPFETTHEALRHLAVALPLPDTNNRFSFALWKLYLIIYRARADHDLGEIMSVCEDAVTCNPAQLYLWEMYISFASLVKDKLDLCDRALQGLGSPSLLTPDEKSYAVLYIVLLRVRIEFTSGHITRGMEYLKTVLESNTDIYSCMTAHHKSIGHLHYIHALAFGSLPSLYTLAKYAVNKERVYLLPWKTLPSPSATVVESLRTAFELVTYNGPEQDHYVMVYLNYIHMEMSLGNKDDACFLCQHYLTSVPHSDRLLVAYALALEAMGNVSDAELSYQKWLQRKGSNKSFLVWNEYARLALRKAKPSSGEQAIAILTDSVRKHMLENNVRPPALDSSKSEFSQTRYMFHMLLRLDLPSSSSSLLSISEVSQVGNYSSDLYLWLNYAMFETLVRSDDAIVEDVFRNALLRLENIEDRKRIWLEYISWSKNESSEEYIQQVVDEALNDVSIDIKAPVSTHEPEYFIDNPAYVHLVTPYPFKDYEFHNEVIDQFLAYISGARRKLVLERSVAHFHNTNLPLSLRAAELEESLGNFNRAVAYLSSAIRNAPFNSDIEPCLIKLLDISAKAGDSEEQRSSFEKAVQILPISARIWKRFIDFEQASSNNTEIQQLVAEKDIECEIS